ncbi:ribonuclease P protein subunit p21 isoform X5 [Grus americana]|uniref:ribonuclease P protein subunit p21 isoform X5 n=1 Tax=Grus americana TaxID=9117 RepID=UPI00240819A0|nr:ribonuclease P protein subunit p21 isoform X5 [Grus americana]
MAAPVRDREALQRLNFLFQPGPGPVLLQYPARGRPPPGPAHGPLGETHRVPPLLLPAAARVRGLPAPAGGRAAPHRPAVPELWPQPPLPLPAGAPPPRPDPAHRGQPGINPT